jgi:hypothetical protein
MKFYVAYTQRRKRELGGWPYAYSFSSTRYNGCVFMKAVDVCVGICVWVSLRGVAWRGLATDLAVYYACVILVMIMADVWTGLLCLCVYWLLGKHQELLEADSDDDDDNGEDVERGTRDRDNESDDSELDDLEIRTPNSKLSTPDTDRGKARTGKRRPSDKHKKGQGGGDKHTNESIAKERMKAAKKRARLLQHRREMLYYMNNDKGGDEDDDDELSDEDEEEKSDYSASNSDSDSDESDDDEVDDRDIDIAVDVSRSTITRGNRNDQFAANTARINHGPNSNNSSSRNKFNLRIKTQLQQSGNAGTKVMNRHSHSGSDGDRDSTGTNTNRNTPTKFLDAYKRQYARGSSLGSIQDEQETEPSQHVAAGSGAGAGAGVGVGPSDSSKNFESTRPEGIRTVGTRAGSGAAAGAGAGTGHGAEDMVSHCGSVPVSRRLNLWGITACV